MLLSILTQPGWQRLHPGVIPQFKNLRRRHHRENSSNKGHGVKQLDMGLGKARRRSRQTLGLGLRARPQRAQLREPQAVAESERSMSPEGATTKLFKYMREQRGKCRNRQRGLSAAARNHGGHRRSRMPASDRLFCTERERCDARCMLVRCHTIAASGSASSCICARCMRPRLAAISRAGTALSHSCT